MNETKAQLRARLESALVNAPYHKLRSLVDVVNTRQLKEIEAFLPNISLTAPARYVDPIEACKVSVLVNKLVAEYHAVHLKQVKGTVKHAKRFKNS